MNFLIALMALIITAFFTYNFKEILKKIKEGKTINKLSLLATSTLVIHFFCLSIYFCFHLEFLVLFSELYMLGCLVYLLRKKK